MSTLRRSSGRMRIPGRPWDWGLDLPDDLVEDRESPLPPTPLPIDAPVFPADSTAVPTVTPANLNCGWARNAAGALVKTHSCAMDMNAAGSRPTRARRRRCSQSSPTVAA